MRSFRSRSLRRLVAVGLALGLGLFNLEQLVPELHEGEAAHQEWTGNATGEAAGHAASGNPAPPTQPHSEQAAHVCHSAHGHGTYLVASPLAFALAADSATATVEAGTPLPSIVPDLQSPPPRA